ncbi:MAG: hypothetical protein QNJ55_14840 [Xenococcus sp. MO_188.B8]|nr:hypothetical protein [Xenococcus sp. MO_188.B8]
MSPRLVVPGWGIIIQFLALNREKLRTPFPVLIKQGNAGIAIA